MKVSPNSLTQIGMTQMGMKSLHWLLLDTPSCQDSGSLTSEAMENPYQLGTGSLLVLILILRDFSSFLCDSLLLIADH